MKSQGLKNKRVYMDYASATPVDARVKKHMCSIEDKLVGNPDALHKEGRFAKKILEDARVSIAHSIHSHSDEIVFTSGATEANNIALLGVLNKLLPIFQKPLLAGRKAPHIIVSTIEHKSVLETAHHMEALGADVSYIHPNEEGIVSAKDIRDAIKPTTILVSVMYANNEIGTIEPIREIAKEIRKARQNLKMIVAGAPYFHTDAAQAVNYCDMNVLQLGVDLLTISSPKIYGPAGIGALFVRRFTPIASIVFGGGQESGIRSGRELSLLATGFAKALEIVEQGKAKESKRLIALRDYFFKHILTIGPNISINGSMKSRLPNNVNICAKNLDSEFAVYELDARGIACSSASTCINLSEDSYSYVVEEINQAKNNTNCSKSSLRFSLGRNTTKKEIDYCLKALRDVILGQQNIYGANH